MDRLELLVEARAGTGKGAARRLRAQGSVPAIVYGTGIDPVPVAVHGRELQRVLGTNQLINLTGLENLQGKPVLVKEFQRDPLSQHVLHCDFFAVDTTKPIQVEVPIHFSGRAKGVELGGVFEPLLREVEVACLPGQIPSTLDVDIADLDIADVLYAGQLRLPPGVELITDPDLSVAHVVAPRVETTAEGAEEAGGAAAGSTEAE